MWGTGHLARADLAKGQRCWATLRSVCGDGAQSWIAVKFQPRNWYNGASGDECTVADIYRNSDRNKTLIFKSCIFIMMTDDRKEDKRTSNKRTSPVLCKRYAESVRHWRGQHVHAGSNALLSSICFVHGQNSICKNMSPTGHTLEFDAREMVSNSRWQHVPSGSVLNLHWQLMPVCV